MHNTCSGFPQCQGSYAAGVNQLRWPGPQKQLQLGLWPPNLQKYRVEQRPTTVLIDDCKELYTIIIYYIYIYTYCPNIHIGNSNPPFLGSILTRKNGGGYWKTTVTTVLQAVPWGSGACIGRKTPRPTMRWWRRSQWLCQSAIRQRYRGGPVGDNDI